MSGVVDFLFVYHDKFLLSAANIYLNRLMGKDGLGHFADVLEDDVLVVFPKPRYAVACQFPVVPSHGAHAFVFIEKGAAFAPYA